MTKEYKASLQLNNELSVVYFTTEGSPVEYLWAHYGISTYIEYVEEVEPEPEEEEEEVIETVEAVEEISEEVEPEEVTE